MVNASASDVQRNFGRYHDMAQAGPVVVTKHGRPSVVILAAEDYRRLRARDRQAMAATELAESEITAIAAAEVPAKAMPQADIDRAFAKLQQLGRDHGLDKSPSLVDELIAERRAAAINE